MKKITFAFFPLLLLGFIIPDTLNQSGSKSIVMTNAPYDGPYVLYKNDKVFI